MKCERVQALLPAYLESALGRFSRGRVDAHLKECSACRSEARAIQRTVALVRGAGIERAPEGFAAGVMARLPLQPAPAPRFRLLRPLVFVPTGLVAAALVAALQFAPQPNTGELRLAADRPNDTYVREYAHFRASQDVGGGAGVLMLASELTEDTKGGSR